MCHAVLLGTDKPSCACYRLTRVEQSKMPWLLLPGPRRGRGQRRQWREEEIGGCLNPVEESTQFSNKIPQDYREEVLKE